MKIVLVLFVTILGYTHSTAQSPYFWGVNFYRNDVEGLKLLAARKGAKPLVSKKRERNRLEYIGTFDGRQNVHLIFDVFPQNVRDRNAKTGVPVYAGYAVFDHLSKADAARLVDEYSAKFSTKYSAPDFSLSILSNRYNDVVIYTWRKAGGSISEMPSVVRRIYDKPDSAGRQVIIGCCNNYMFDLPPATSAKDSTLDAANSEY